MIYPPLIIGTVGVVVHYFIAKYFVVEMGYGVLGVAWAKNISEAFNALVLYVYIIKKQPTQ